MLSFFVSLVIYLAGGKQFQEVLAYFPDSAGKLGTPERQFIPGRGALEERIRWYTEEVLLGPIDILKRSFINPSTKVEALFYDQRSGRLTISLSTDAIQSSERMPPTYGFADAESNLRRNLRANFPSIREVSILVAGQVPGEPAFQIVGMSESSGI